MSLLTVSTVAELREYVQHAKFKGLSVGFVPTMGNLHAGHMRLVKKANKQCDIVIVSIFVNPLQFNNPSDLTNYPRTLEQDQDLLADNGCNLLFAPTVNEMYPNGQESQSIVAVPDVSMGLCGGSRPGHFNGVATVVTKLFNMVQADKAFFGEKDFQQLAVIR
jgi:pantoate--beta-alanine ligase